MRLSVATVKILRLKALKTLSYQSMALNVNLTTSMPPPPEYTYSALFHISHPAKKLLELGGRNKQALLFTG